RASSTQGWQVVQIQNGGTSRLHTSQEEVPVALHQPTDCDRSQMCDIVHNSRKNATSNQSGFSEETLVRLFIQRYAKPLMKEILLEFFRENEMMFVSLKEPKHQLLTTDDVAKLLSVTRHTVYQYMKMGLPSFKAGNTHKFRFEDVQ